MKGLGGFLRSTIRGDFEPYFLLEEETHRSGAIKIPLTEASINHMYLRGYFNIDPIQIQVSKELASTKISLCLQSDPYPSGITVLPISGFPRQLISEDRSRKGKRANLHSSNQFQEFVINAIPQCLYTHVPFCSTVVTQERPSDDQR
jgi:hypothetical protein